MRQSLEPAVPLVHGGTHAPGWTQTCVTVAVSRGCVCSKAFERAGERGHESSPPAAGQRGEPGPGTVPAPPRSLGGGSESRGAGRVGKASSGTAFFWERAGDEGLQGGSEPAEGRRSQAGE